MTEAMAFWLREADIDGFRCDVASLVAAAPGDVPAGRHSIDWKGLPLADFYAWLIGLKRSEPALTHGLHGGRLIFHDTGNDAVIAYRRQHALGSVQVRVNLSGVSQSITGADATMSSLAPWHWDVQRMD